MGEKSYWMLGAIKNSQGRVESYVLEDRISHEEVIMPKNETLQLLNNRGSIWNVRLDEFDRLIHSKTGMKDKNRCITASGIEYSPFWKERYKWRVHKLFTDLMYVCISGYGKGVLRQLWTGGQYQVGTACKVFINEVLPELDIPKEEEVNLSNAIQNISDIPAGFSNDAEELRSGEFTRKLYILAQYILYDDKVFSILKENISYYKVLDYTYPITHAFFEYTVLYNLGREASLMDLMVDEGVASARLKEILELSHKVQTDITKSKNDILDRRHRKRTAKERRMLDNFPIVKDTRFNREECINKLGFTSDLNYKGKELYVIGANVPNMDKYKSLSSVLGDLRTIDIIYNRLLFLDNKFNMDLFPMRKRIVNGDNLLGAIRNKEAKLNLLKDGMSKAEYRSACRDIELIRQIADVSNSIEVLFGMLFINNPKLADVFAKDIRDKFDIAHIDKLLPKLRLGNIDTSGEKYKESNLIGKRLGRAKLYYDSGYTSYYMNADELPKDDHYWTKSKFTDQVSNGPRCRELIRIKSEGKCPIINYYKLAKFGYTIEHPDFEIYIKILDAITSENVDKESIARVLGSLRYKTFNDYSFAID